MKREQVLRKVIFDYLGFFHHKDVDKYKEEIIKFQKEHSSLTNDEFFSKFQEQFAMTETLHKALSRQYLSKIASSVNTIKIILIIYFILSVIVAGFAVNSFV